MKKNQLGEIATILTLSTLIIIGLSSLASSFFLKNRQTTASKAVEECTDYKTESEANAGCDPQGFEPVPGVSSCWRCKGTSSASTTVTSSSTSSLPLPCTDCVEDGRCIYFPERDPRSGKAPPGTPQCTDTGCVGDASCQTGRTCAANGEDCSSKTCCAQLTCNKNKCEPDISAKEKDEGKRCQNAKGLNYTNEFSCESDQISCKNGCEQVADQWGYVKDCYRCKSCSFDQLDKTLTCNPACCGPSVNCPSGQSCSVPNGYCMSGTSCAPNAPGSSKPKLIRMCSGASCAWTFCDGKNADISKCTEDWKSATNDSPSTLCDSDSDCISANPTRVPGVNSCIAGGQKLSCPTQYKECKAKGKAVTVMRDCTYANDSGCVFYCKSKTGGKAPCDSKDAELIDDASCKGPAYYVVGQDKPKSSLTCTPYQCPEGTQKYNESQGGAYIYTRSVQGKTKYFLTLANCNDQSKQGKDTFEDHCGKKNLPGTPDTTTPATPVATGKCTNYGATPIEPNITCPDTRTEECYKQIDDSQGNTRIITGTAYVKIACGSGNDSCQYSCKTVNDLSTDKYSSRCGTDDTCIEPITGGTSSVNVTVKSNLINCGDRAEVYSIVVVQTDNGLENRFGKSDYNPPLKRNAQETYKVEQNKIPSRDITYDAYINIKYNGTLHGIKPQNKEVVSSLTSKNITLQIDFQCN